MSTDTSSLVLQANEGASDFLASGEFFTWKATAETTEGKYDQVEEVTLPQAGPLEHTHIQDETIYVLAGTYRIKVSDYVFTASVGDFVRIPAGTPHTWRCLGRNAGKMLITFAPGGIRGFFEEIRPLYLAPELDIPAATAIADRYGLAITGPALTDED